MAEPYLRDLKHWVDRSALPTTVEVVVKHFFAGAAGYVDGKIFVSLTPVGLALKLPEDERRRLFAGGAIPLRYFPNAPIKKDYVLFATYDSGDTDLLSLIRASASYVAPEH